jgi:hypothetical protein
MKNKKLKRWTLVNLITGYMMVGLFVLLIILNRSPEVVAEEIVINDLDTVYADDLFNGVRKDELKTEVLYVDGHPVHHTTRVVRDNSIGIDRSHGVILDDDPDVIVIRDDVIDNVAVVRNPDHVVIHDRDDIYVDNGRGVDIIGGNNYDRIHNRTDISRDHRDHTVVRGNGTDRVRTDRTVVDDVDLGLLDRRLADLDAVDDVGLVDIDAYNRAIKEGKDRVGLTKDNAIDLGGLTLARDGDDVELGDIEDLNIKQGTGKDEYGIGKGGQLYAYNFPSRGVGAGIGSGGIGAGAGGSAGLGAGIGQGILNGETVPTLGGVGTYSTVEVVPPGTGTDTDGDGLTAEAEALLGTDPQKADSDGDGFVDGAEISSYTDPKNASSNPNIPGSESSPTLGGVGGLVGGAGAGGAAGLVTGMVKEKLGIGIGPGKGCAEHGGNCNGHHGHGRHTDYDHLPKDGALYIMMHVDGSGSILNTRKQLDIMKDTLLKDALLPYYNNDENLYNRRVTIVDGNGERTLQFFTEAAKKDNVLAVVFQDEAQPAYHLPTFNKKPQDHYSKDLGKLKASLAGYGGIYRGVMFQTDRGRTFAKSFKEFVECAWRGEGYLKNDNLKKYYWENNQHHIKNKDGIVFSDIYHTKDEGDPQYYLDLIFEASKKVGLDLDIYGAGITDGKYNSKTD